jgi:hypothetical protein
MEALAMVPPWLGAIDVVPSTVVTQASGTSSSSATICASAVARPVPRSTWPCKRGDGAVVPDRDQDLDALVRVACHGRRLAGTGAAGGGGSRVTSSTPCAEWKSARVRGWSARRVIPRSSRKRCAASCTACRISRWAPQRHRLARQLAPHVVLGRIGVAREQGHGHHHHAVEAVAALRGLRIDEGLLHRMQRASPSAGPPAW